MACEQTTRAGTRCRAASLRGKRWCKWHSPSEEDVARRLEASARGGRASLLPDPPALDALESVAECDLHTAVGLRQLTAATLRALARVPFDYHTANAIAQLLSAQRQILQTADFDARLAALEELLTRFAQPSRERTST